MRTNDLKFFENFLQERRRIILGNIQSNSKEIGALHNSAPSDNANFSAIKINPRIDFAIGANLEQELKEIEESPKKIQHKNYGICESCNELIDIERFKIRPHARYCIVCRGIVEKGNTQ